jgi:hypothetical protein
MLNLIRVIEFTKLCFFLVLITGCSSTVTPPVKASSDSGDYITRSEIEPFLQQWDSKRESLDRLAELEGDLKILLDLVSNQVNIAELPESLREDVKQIEHRVHNQAEDEIANISVKLGTYFNAVRADAALKQFSMRFPDLATIINTHIKKIQLSQSERYLLVGTQLSSLEEGEELCVILKRMSQRCEVFTTRLEL